MLDVTVVILTKNEEVNLPDCLESVKDFATRCVVIDSGSIDKTKEIAAKFSADFYEHPFENYARQFNWALDNTNITTKWTFRLDADERLTSELKIELSGLVQNMNQMMKLMVLLWKLGYIFLVIKLNTVAIPSEN